MPPLRRTLAVALVAVLAACSGGGDDAAEDAEVSERSAERPDIRLEVTRSELVSPHQARTALPEPAASQVTDVVQAFFQATVADAAVLGEPGDATSLLTEGALGRLRTKDYRALVDDHVGPVEGLEAERARVGLIGLSGDDNAPALVVAAIDWRVRSLDGAVRIERRGELSLVPVPGTRHGWQIAAYSVLTDRVVEGVSTTTTAEGGD